MRSPSKYSKILRMRKTPFVEGEYYHVYNRGVDKRDIFSDTYDMPRFLQSMKEFNTIEPIGSIYENSFRKSQLGDRISKLRKEPLVNIICYCLNLNHYHLLLQQVAKNGISEFMRRLGIGYTYYFNERYKRNGVLFQGRFKSSHINSNEYLLHVSAYINLNNKVHKLGDAISKSSWEEYINQYAGGICNKDIILGQFKKPNEYKHFSEEALEGILERREKDENFSGLLLE